MSPFRATILLGVTLLAPAVATAADILELKPGQTSVPPIYLMHYTPDAPRSSVFVDQIRVAPPDILHLGHAVPLNSIFGPTADYSGFKPKLVPADDLLSRKEELRKFVTLLHQAGVKKVIPYINPSILGGDHENSKGFFDFYRHWEDYAALGLGAKPERSPELWMQRNRRSFAPWEPEPNYPLWRYEPCPNEPGWRQYQSTVVRLIAECGFDGVFVDDCVMQCRHDLCRQRFDDFLQKRYPAKTISRMFGADPSLAAGESSGRSDAHTDPAANLRKAETYLFWQNSIADILAELNRSGRAVNPDFFTVPNWGASARVGGAGSRVRSGKNSAVWQRSSTCQLLEEDHPTGYAGPQDAISYLLQYNYGLALGIRPAILSYGTTRGHVELGYAEAAAGGGGAYVESTAAYPQIRSKWSAFFEANRDLFNDFRLAAPVGLIFSIDEPRYGNDKHLRDVLATARAFYGLHIPFATVPAGNLTASQLARYKVLAVPRVQHLSDAQLKNLKLYVHHGGRLLIDAESGTRDWLDLQRRPPFDEPGVTRANATPPVFRSGKGAVVLITSFEELVPQRELAFVDALDVRDEKAFVARIKDISEGALDTEAENRFHQWFTALAGTEVTLAEGARNVHIVAYERLGNREGSLVIHAVRYSAATWGDELSFVQPAPLKLVVPLPSGWEIQRASVRQPEKPTVLADVHVDSNRAHCKIPVFEFYSMLHLELKRAARR